MRAVVKDRCLLWWNSSFVKEWESFTTLLLSAEALSFRTHDLMSNYFAGDWLLDGVFGMPINVFYLVNLRTISWAGLKYNFELWNCVALLMKKWCHRYCYLGKKGSAFHLMLWPHPWKSQTEVGIDTAEGKGNAVSRYDFYLLVVSNLAWIAHSVVGFHALFIYL